MNCSFSIWYQGLLWVFPVKLASGECHKTSLMISHKTLVQVMAGCHQATSHYLIQCWPRSISPHVTTKSHPVNCDLLMPYGIKDFIHHYLWWLGNSCSKPSHWLYQLRLHINLQSNWKKLEIVDQWSTRIPPPHRRGWHCSKSQDSHFESDIADNR